MARLVVNGTNDYVIKAVAVNISRSGDANAQKHERGSFLILARFIERGAEC
jgi:hypothetical protein